MIFKKIAYIWSKIIKKIPYSSILNSYFEKPSKVEARSTVINTYMGYYSFCGYNCTLINCKIGRFCSISDNVSVGLAEHPISWISTSSAFYYGKDSIPKNIAKLSFEPAVKQTVIGNDVWIGKNALIKAGVNIGDGAVIGMGSIVTKNIPPYSIAAGNPAQTIKMRFSEEIIAKLNEVQWWNMSVNEIKEYAQFANNPDEFLMQMEKHK